MIIKIDMKHLVVIYIYIFIYLYLEFGFTIGVLTAQYQFNARTRYQPIYDIKPNSTIKDIVPHD